jgi:CRISPR-associated protein Cas6/Cse3/CasE subtype I-E
MYLSLATSNKISNNLETLHKKVWEFFPNSIDRDFLFRVEEKKIWMLSAKKPVTPEWCNEINTKEQNPKFSIGDCFSFEVVINPVENSTIPKGMINARRTKSIPQNEIGLWFYNKCLKNGFTISNLTISEKTNRPIVGRGSKKGGFRYVTEVLVSGELKIENVSLFENAYTKGVSKSKHLGFGLLLLRRV